MALAKLYSFLADRLTGTAPAREVRPSLTLRTERLRLRELEAADLEPVLAYRSDPEVVRYLDFSGPQNRVRVWEYVFAARHQRFLMRRTNYELGILLAHNGRLIGECGLGLLYADVSAERPYAALLGFILHREQWGRGYATEAAGAVLRFAFEELKLDAVYAGCLPENTASRRVLEKSGLVLEGLRSQFPGSPLDVTALAFRLDREQWLAQHVRVGTDLPEDLGGAEV